MWSAYEGKDTTYVGGLHDGAVKRKEEGAKLGGFINGENPLAAAEFEFDMVFGCQTRITNLFLTQLADGIMGMCLKDTSIWKQMFEQDIIKHPAFALCFARGDDAAKDGTMAGTLTLGGIDTKLHEEEVVYAKGFKTKGVMHGVRIRKVHIMKSGVYDSKSANTTNTITAQISEDQLNKGSVIVDSGTTDTYFTKTLKAPFLAAFKELVGFDYNTRGMKLTDTQVQSLPTILVQLVGIPQSSEPGTPGLAHKIDTEHPDDILIAIPPAHYVEYDSDNEKYVGRFSVDEGRGSVIGANTMRGHDVFFDIPENDRIGFAVSDCDYRNLAGLELENEIDEHNVNHHEIKEEEESEEGDDYYEESETPKFTEFEDGNGFDYQNNGDGSASRKCDDRCKAGGAIGFTFAAFIAFLVYKRKRETSSYRKAIEENEHLNDLVLDTEIQLTEIS